MTLLRTIICILLLSLSSQAQAAGQPAAIDRLMEGAIGENLIAGGVVLVGNRSGILFLQPYGRVSAAVDARPMTVDTVFDIASLTKVVATTPSVLKLAAEGRLSLTDPLQKWFPEFAGRGKENVLVYNLLTHTSGLDDFSLTWGNALPSAIQGAALQQLKGEVGSRFRYADINFILLAELVRRVTGAGLDLYSYASFFHPLAMNDTAFNPLKKERCAATIMEEKVFTGEPQDPLCRQLGGVAGHAGLFSTALDLARFCRMMLSGGELEGRRVLEARAVQQMTAPYFSRGGRVVRGLGWDIASPYSSPRGEGFSGASFGHTGYSGSSIWIDPEAEVFVVLLTSRTDYRRVNEFNKLRRDLSTIACTLFGVPAVLREMADLNDL